MESITPNSYRTQFRVDVKVVSGRTVKLDDDMPPQMHGFDDLEKTVTYTGDLQRVEGSWELMLQWVDLDGNGHRFVLPHEFLERLFAHRDNIMKRSRSGRSLRAAETKRAS